MELECLLAAAQEYNESEKERYFREANELKGES